MSVTFLSSLCSPMRIASIAGSGIKSLFTGIDSRDTAVLAVSSTRLIYSFMSFFYLFIYFFVIANIFFFKSIASNLLSRIPYSVSVSGLRIQCFSASEITVPR